MVQVGSELLDYAPIWTFVLLFTRFSGVFLGLPGIGTEAVAPPFRMWLAAIMALVITLTGAAAPEAANTGEAVAMIGSEFALGFALGMVPSFVLAGLAVAGQVVSAAIGLGQANMIDRSLGVPVAVLAKFKTTMATVIFLLLDGHHLIIRAAAGVPGRLALGFVGRYGDIAQLFQEELIRSFELAVMASAPILVTTLVTQFIFGLVTKFVPQVNIFIVSLPLGLLVGFYVMEFSLPGLFNLIVQAFGSMDESIARLIPPL